MGHGAATRAWGEPFAQALADGRRTAAADLALGALFAASHAAHHVLAELESRCGPGSEAAASANGADGGLDEARAEAVRLLAEIGAAGEALGRALFDALPAPTGDRQADAAPLALAAAIAEAHAELGELVAAWHRATDEQSPLADFAPCLVRALAALPRLAGHIAPRSR